MKKVLISLTVFIMLLMTACVNNSQHAQPKVVPLENIGLEGNLQNSDTAYSITDLTEIGIYTLAVKKDKLEEQIKGGIYSVIVSNHEYFLETNPYNSNIIETTIDEVYSLNAIKAGRIKTIDASRKKELLTKKEPRENISMAQVIIDKQPGENGTTLYQIATNIFISMRNAYRFVFDENGDFIPPAFVVSSEGNTYSINTFISARNASADSSIHGAFAFLKAHPHHNDLLETIYPNRVRVEDGEIIIDPPENVVRRLRDLGPEGNLQEEENVYNILNNTAIGYWSVSIKPSRLPEPEKSAQRWKLVLEDNEYLFSQSELDPAIYETDIPDAIAETVDDVRDAFFEMDDEPAQNKIKFLYADGSPSYFRYYFYDSNGNRVSSSNNVCEIDTTTLEPGIYQLLVVGGPVENPWSTQNFFFYEEVEIDGTGNNFIIENFENQVSVAAKDPTENLVLATEQNYVYIGYLDDSTMRIHGIFVYQQPIYIQGNVDYLGVNCRDAGLFLSTNPNLSRSTNAQTIVLGCENTGEIIYMNNTPFENSYNGVYPGIVDYYAIINTAGNSLIVSPGEYTILTSVFVDNYSYSIQNEQIVPINENQQCFFEFGGNLAIQNPVNNNYSLSDTIRFYSHNLLKDSYNNNVQISKYKNDQSNSTHQFTDISTQTPGNGQMNQRRDYLDHITLKIVDSNDQIIYEETLGANDRFEYTLNQEGHYKIRVEIDTGNWQGVLQETFPFTVINEEINLEDLLGFWEGDFTKLDTGEAAPGSMTVQKNGDDLSIWISRENDFNVPINGDIEGNTLILERQLGDWRFDGTLMFLSSEKETLVGNIRRTNISTGGFDAYEILLEKYTSDYTGWAQDVEYFKETLPEKHINLFFKATEQEFNQACDNLIEIANSISEAEVFLALKAILALIDDVHTNTWSYWKYQMEYYPFEFRKIGNEHYIFSASEGYEDYLGAKLSSINGHDIEQIRNKTEKIIPAENEIRVEYETPSYLNSPEALEYCQVVEVNSETFVLEKEGVQETLEPVRLTKNQYYNNRSNLNWTPSIAEKNTHLNFWYEFLEEESILYFQYNRCRDHTEPGLPKFAEVQEKIMEILENNQVEKFVADLRYNGGGSNTYGTNLARALGRLNIGTDFYVIIGNQTFSSAIINSLDFRNYCDARLVGEPSSAKPNGYGEVKMFQLPNSGLTIQYSTKYFQLVDEDIEYLAPDIPVYRSFNDYINGIDTVLEYIKDLKTNISIKKVSGKEGYINASENNFSWELVSEGIGLDHYEYKIDDGNWIETVQTAYTWEGYSEGEHTFSVRAIDSEGDFSTELSWSFYYTPNTDVNLQDFIGTWQGECLCVTNNDKYHYGVMEIQENQQSLTVYFSCKTEDGHGFNMAMTGTLENNQLRVSRVSGDWAFEGTYTFIDSEKNVLVGEIIRSNDTSNRYDKWECQLTKKKLFKVNGTEGYTEDTAINFSWEYFDEDSVAEYYEYKKDNNSWERISEETYTWSGFDIGEHVFKVRAMRDNGDYSNEISWEFHYVGNHESEGKFKIANSWGIGGNWENVPDGYYYITYETMKKNAIWANLFLPRQSYLPKALAIFEISHPIRNECSIFVGVGNPNNPRAEKPVYDYRFKGGPFEFPENKIAVDITEFLPLDNESIYLKIEDSDETAATGIIESFSVELYTNSINDDPVNIFHSDDVPKNTIDGNSVIVLTQSVNFAENYSTNRITNQISEASFTPDRKTIEKMKKEIGVAEIDKDYNPVFNGHGTGWMPPTEEGWERIYQEKMIGILDSEKLYSARAERLPSSVDNSATKYFPGIGDQGRKGSCVCFAVGYYIATYYRAKDNNWDLSNSSWVGNGPASNYLDKIMSPDFLYHQVYYYMADSENKYGGSNSTDNIELLTNIGIATWEKMPYDDQEFERWPTEEAWRNAPFHRMDYVKEHWEPLYYSFQIETDQDVLAVKQLLADGYLLSISVDAGQYKNLTEEDLWTIFNYDDSNGTNHANTIVGYFDN